MSVFEFVIAGINFLAALVILFFVIKIIGEVRGTKLFNTAILFLLASITFVGHAGIEIIGLGEILYALTGLIISIFLAGAIYYANLSTKAMGV